MKRIKKQTGYYEYNMTAAAGVFVLLCAFPFFITNGYHNITASKYYFFCGSTGFFTLLTAAVYLALNRKDKPFKKFPGNYTEYFMIVFSVVCVFSCLLSRHRTEALTGSAGRRMGLIMMIAMIAAYFFIARFYKLRYMEFDLFGISLIIMCAFAVAQYMGLDPFSLLADIAKKKRVAFIGLLGNINVFASYLCIAVPLFMYLFCVESKKKRVILSALASAFGCCGVYASNSDTGILGLAAALFIIFLFCCKKSEYFSRFWLLISVCSFSSFLFWALTRLLKNQCRRASYLYSGLLNPWILTAVFFASSALYVLVRRFPLSEKSLKIIRNTAAVLSITLFIGFLSDVVYFSVFNKTMKLGKLSAYLRFNDKWGSERGTVWRSLFKAYLKLPVTDKLIGSGEDTVVFVIREAFGSAVKTTKGQLFDNAHNEFLQYLVTLGFFGLVFYLISVIAAVKAGLKSDSVLKRAVSICVCVYLVQSFFTITQPITTPLLFVFLGLTQAETETCR